MKTLALLLALVSCNNDNQDRRTTQTTPSTKVINCTTAATDGGARINCPDGTTTEILNGADSLPGKDGVKGDTGAAGRDGKPGSEGIKGDKGDTGAEGIQGAQGPLGPVGPAGVTGTNGSNGTNGVDGTNGTNGANGTSCTVSYTAVGATITCGGSSVAILNGTNGSSGTAVTPIRLCADSSSGYPEYGFLIDSYIYAVYYGTLDSNGNPSSSGVLQAFMAKLTPGNYMSTNGSGCTFTINADGSITR